MNISDFTNKIHHADCLEILKKLPDSSVDLMLQDPPYSVLNACKWDKAINIPEMWLEWERVLKPNGAWVFTATQPFASELITSRRGFFKYEWIWRKNKFGNFLNAKIQPLRNHENVLVFYRLQPTYNPQPRIIKHTGKYGQNATKTKAFNISGEAAKNYSSSIKTGDLGKPTSVIEIDVDSEAFASNLPTQNRHPTQKPLELFRYLIRTYSNEGDLVFDGYSGSGTTALASLKENRNFICCETDSNYHKMSVERLEKELLQPVLF